MSTFINYYKVLGIEDTASMGEIKKAYRAIAKRLHPDAFPNVDFTEKELKKMREDFALANEAYVVLNDEKQRKEYDRKYHNYLEQLKQQEEERKRQEAKRRQEAAEKQREQDSAFEDIEKMFYEAAKKKEEEKKQAEAQTQNKKSNHEDSFYDKHYVLDQMRREYRKIRKKEKQESFYIRHKNIEDCLNDVYGKKINTIPKEIIFHTAKGIVHVFSETLYHLQKLRIESKDTFTGYVIRNRRLIASVLIAGTIASSGLWFKGKQPQSSPKEDISLSETKEIENESVEEEPIVMNRIYKVKIGDNLSTLAYESFSTIDEIKRKNNISSDIIYIGDTFTIPYKIDKENLEYYTQSYPVDNKSLEELASTFQTDVKTIKALNAETIEKIEGVYCINSNTLIVPNFIKREELTEIKGKTH